MSDNIKWVVSIGKDEYPPKTYSTREECIQYGLKTAKIAKVDEFYIEKQTYFVPHVNAENIINDIKEDSFRFVKLFDFGYLKNVSSEEYYDLETSLNDVFRKWSKKYNKDAKLNYNSDDEEIIKVKDCEVDK